MQGHFWGRFGGRYKRKTYIQMTYSHTWMTPMRVKILPRVTRTHVMASARSNTQKICSGEATFALAKYGQSSYWTAKLSFFFLTSDQHEGGNLGPKLHPGGGFFGP